MKDPEKLKELLLEKVDFGTVLQDYGAKFVYNPSKADEVQLKCPFHGEDNKPSARYYSETQSMFCWVCHKRWDIFEFIMDKEVANFIQALKILVKKYNVDTSSIPDRPEFKLEKSKPTTSMDFERLMSGDSELPGLSSVSDQKSELSLIRKNIRELRGKLPFDKYRALSGALGMVRFALSKGMDSGESVLKLKNKLQTIQG